MPQNADTAVQATVYKNKDMPSSDLHNTGNAVITVFSSRSPDKQETNDDAAAIIDVAGGTTLLIVADGVGGLPSGHMASGLVIDSIRKTVRSGLHDTRDLRHAILSAIETANQQIIEAGSGAATTLAIAEIRDSSIRTYHVGDSMILVTGQRGRLKMETISHSPVGYALEAGMLSHEDAIHHDERHLVSNVVGNPDLHISMGIPFILAPRDTLLLATDGLFDNVHRDEIIEFIRKGELRESADRLSEFARQRMESEIEPYKPDDLTFILYRGLRTQSRRQRDSITD